MQCGLPTLTTLRLRKHAAIGQGESQVDAARIGGGPCQRDFVPGEARRAHVDADKAVHADPRVQRPGARFDGNPVAPKARTKSAATQRLAFPQALTSEPSAFRMRMNTSAAPEGSSTIT